MWYMYFGGEPYSMKTVEEIISIHNMQRGVRQVFWLVQLNRENANLCIFNSHFSSCMFKWLPFGIISVTEVYHSILSQMFEDLDGLEIIVDDLLIWNKNDQNHNQSWVLFCNMPKKRTIIWKGTNTKQLWMILVTCRAQIERVYGSTVYQHISEAASLFSKTQLPFKKRKSILLHIRVAKKTSKMWSKSKWCRNIYLKACLHGGQSVSEGCNL